MSRYTGPRLRKCRRLGIDLPGLTRKSIEKRPARPGMHGSNPRRRPSEYAFQLAEKQKLRFNYGLRERQLRRLFEEAKRGAGTTGARLLELLERRLDNVVFRAGFAPTIPAARQLVNHGHITVDGSRVDIPSYRVSVGEVIGVRKRKRVAELVAASIAAPSLPTAAWLEVASESMTARLTSLPPASTVPFDIDVQLVVEHYSR
ncbi:MAG: 30S ribosomal protein S4 [Nannocystaceae bacterium]